MSSKSSSKTKCAKCGSANSSVSLPGFCAKCLLLAGISEKTAPDGAALDPASGGRTLSQEPAKKRLGDYTDLAELGRGGMGIVFRAYQTSLKRPVALKIISEGIFASRNSIARFYTEAKAAAKLDHPNIVPIHEVGQAEGFHFYSMKLLEGGALRAKCGRAEPDWVARILVKVSRAVHYAHEHGVLHRDLKPENILFDQAGEPHVTDFGLAKLLDEESSRTLDRAILGSPAYMAPEQALGTRNVTTAADLFSLGAILYELLAGRIPFPGSSPLETLHRVLHSEPARLSGARPGNDRDLEAICFKCLEKKPELRYRTAAELADDLERWLRREPIIARPAGPVERIWKWSARHQLLASVSAALAVSLLAGAIAVLWQYQRAVRNEAAARENLYVADMNLAFRAFEENDLWRARMLLDRHQPAPREKDLRGWEWHYLDRQFSSDSIATYNAGEARIMGVAFVGQSSNFVSLSAYGSLALWETGKSEPLRRVAAQSFSTALAISEKSGTLWVSRLDGGIEGWSLPSLTPVPLQLEHPGHNVLLSIAVSPAGDYMGSVHDAIYIRNLTNGALEHTIPVQLPQKIVFSPDGIYFAAGLERSGEILVFETESGLLKSRWVAHTFLGPYLPTLLELNFSPDGEELISSGHDQRVAIWRWRTGELVRELTGIQGHTARALYSPNGEFLVTGGADQVLRVWEAGTGRVLHQFRGHQSEIFALAITADNIRILSGDRRGQIRLWNARAISEFSPYQAVELPSMGEGIAYNSHNGFYMLAQHADGARLWDLRQMRARTNLVEAGVGAVSGDGRFSARWNTNLTRIAVLDHESGVVAAEFESPVPGHIWPMAFSADSRLLAVKLSDSSLAAWEVRTGRFLGSLPGKPGIWTTLMFTPKNHWVAACTTAGYVHVWDPLQGVEVITWPAHPEPVTDFVWSHNGEWIVTAGFDGKARLWELPRARLRLEIDASPLPLSAVAISLDRRRIVTGGTDGQVKIWDSRTGQQVGTLPSPQGFVGLLSFIPDANALIGVTRSHIVQWRTD